MRKIRMLALGAAGVLAVTSTVAFASASETARPEAGSGSAAQVEEVNSAKLRRAVTVDGILEHARVFQRIANNNDGTRASGTPGYDASAKYVKRTLRQAGYKVSEQTFDFPFFRDLAPATLAQTSPTPGQYETVSLTFSGSGEVTGPLVPIDVVVPAPPTPSSTSGCEADDFPAPASDNAIALIQRGTCNYDDKVINAEAAGYAAAVIFNEGQEGRTELSTVGTLGRPFETPTVALSYADGAALTEQARAGDVEMRVTTETENDPTRSTTNVIAMSKEGDPTNAIVAGAHLDSVPTGPGINDNGSGSAALLETAEQLADLKQKPRQQVRFAFWGAEEFGLVGSEHYVSELSDRGLRNVAANLNFDMLGSTNYVRFVLDGDGSEGGLVGPPGSGQIEGVFADYFAGQDLASDPAEFNGRSDYGPFVEAGIPAGGIDSGYDGEKTVEQAEVYGGTAGKTYDPCYHQACDTMSNLDTTVLGQLGDAAAHGIWTLARTRSGFFEDGSMRADRKQVADINDRGPYARR